MKKLIFLFLFCIGFFNDLHAQDLFPDKCLGIWEGTMYIYGKGALRDSVQIEFTAAETDDPKAWTWKTQYLSEKMPMVGT